MGKTYLEVSDSVDGLSQKWLLSIYRGDQMEAEYTQADNALFEDIDHGKPSDTPIADRLLGLEVKVRRIEEAKRRLSQQDTRGPLAKKAVRKNATGKPR